MTREEGHDWMDSLLERDDYIEDAGFSQRVLVELPAPRRRPRWQSLVLWGSGLVAASVAFVLYPGGATLAESVELLLQFNPAAGAVPLVPLVLLGVVTWGALEAALSE